VAVWSAVVCNLFRSIGSVKAANTVPGLRDIFSLGDTCFLIDVLGQMMEYRLEIEVFVGDHGFCYGLTAGQEKNARGKLPIDLSISFQETNESLQIWNTSNS